MAGEVANILKVMYNWLENAASLKKEKVYDIVDAVFKIISERDSCIQSEAEVEEVTNVLIYIINSANLNNIITDKETEILKARVRSTMLVLTSKAYAEDYAIRGINKFLQFNKCNYSTLDEDRGIQYSNMLQPYEIGCTVQLCYNILRSLSQTNAIHTCLVELGCLYYDFMLNNYINRNHIVAYLNVVDLLGYIHPKETYFDIVKRGIKAYQEFNHGDAVPIVNDKITEFLTRAGLGIDEDNN